MTQNKNLNLMPGSGKEFANKDYWEKFFKLRGDKAFEWYGEYENLCGLIHQYIKPTEKILMVGCGNSKLSESMYDVGKLTHIINIDLSDNVIKQMTLKNKKRTDMIFLKMDMLNMTFDNNEFDVVVDKGTLDALMSDESEKVDSDAEKFFNEIDRVLKPGGRYMCISLAQDHILNKLVSVFREKGWIIRVHRIDEHDLDFHLPVFVFVCTKMKIKLTNSIIELKLEYSQEKFTRVDSVNETQSKIKEYQNYGLTKFYISNKSVDAQDEVFVHLYDGVESKYPRYTIYILDSPETSNRSKMNGVFAAFVVPIGKELEWHFGTKLGRQELVSQAQYQRLVIVYLNRAHKYANLDSILDELSPKIIELAPKSLPTNYKIPMLSMGPDLDLRDVKFKGGSGLCGEFFVEDVNSSDQNGELTRRLVFQSIIPTVQTEVILKPDPKNKKSKNLVPNYNFFMEDYFSIVLSQLYTIKFKQEKCLDILIIGLGGGALANYCKAWLPNCNIDAVEIDEYVAECAKNWFGLDKDIKLHIADGLEFVRRAASEGRKWDVVIVDVNSNDPESDLWVPTYDFVEAEYLKCCEEILAKPNGVFVLNMICLKEDVKKMIFERLKIVWNDVLINKLDKNRNEVLFCFNGVKNEIFSADAYQTKSNKDGNSLLLLQEVSAKIKEL